MSNILQTPYNLTKIINSSSFGSLMSNTAPILGGYYLGYSFLLIIFLVSFIYLKGMGRYLNRSCLMASLSLTVISALFLFSMSMIPAGTLWLLIFVWIGVLLILTFMED